MEGPQGLWGWKSLCPDAAIYADSGHCALERSVLQIWHYVWGRNPPKTINLPKIPARRKNTGLLLLPEGHVLFQNSSSLLSKGSLVLKGQWTECVDIFGCYH